MDGNVSQITEALKGKRYKAGLVRRQYIPKPGGKQRPLGIPETGDKLLQYYAAQILSAIFEQNFLACNHGYRQGNTTCYRKAPVGRPTVIETTVLGAAFLAGLNNGTFLLYPVPHRQYVFSIPKIIRRYFLYDRKLLGKLAKCATRSLTLDGLPESP